MTKIVEVPSILQPIQPAPGFEKKELSTHHLELMASCQMKCKYCSSPAGNYQRINRKRFADLTEQQTGERTLPADDPELTLVWPDVLDRLRAQLANKRPNFGEGMTLMLSMLTDAFSPVLLKEGVTQEALRLVLEKTRFRIRILTKNYIVGRPHWIGLFREHPGRFVVGLSIGTLSDDFAKQVELHTSTPTARLRALHNLQDAGVPTFGMLCPVFADVLEGDHLERLVDAVRPQHAEHIWAEPYNDRQNWKKVLHSVPSGSHTAEWLTDVYEHKRSDLWSRGATDLYDRLAAKAKREGWLDKLRYLLYEDQITPSDAPHFAGLQGVLLQSTPNDDGTSKNPAIAALQMPEPSRPAISAIGQSNGRPVVIRTGTSPVVDGINDQKNGTPARTDAADEGATSLLEGSSSDYRPSFPTDVFPDSVAGFVRQVAAAMQCPVDIPAVAALVVAGIAIGAARSVTVKDGWVEMPGIYAAVVANPGQAKTPALREVMRPILEAQDRLIHEFKAGHVSSVAASGGPKSEHPASPAPETLQHLYTTDTTTEALASMLSTSPKGVLLYRDELSAWARSMNLYRGGRGADVPFFLSAWSGEPHRIDRKSHRDGPIVLQHPLLGVLGGIQPDVLPDLEVKSGREDGFLNRVLFSCCDHGQFPGWSEQGIDGKARTEWDKLVGRLLSLEPDCREGSSHQPKALLLTKEGRAVFAKFCDDLSQRVNSGMVAPSLVGVAAKMKSYCARFALVIHLLRHAVGEFGEGVSEGAVDEEDVGRAVRLCDYFMQHAAIAYRCLQQSETDKQVAKLLDWMRRNKFMRCCARDVMRANVAGIKAKSTAEKLFGAAIDRGLGVWDTPTAGKERARRFHIETRQTTNKQESP